MSTIGAMQLYLFLLLGYTCLQALCAHAGAGEEEDIDPSDLARQLRSEICAMNQSQVQGFYKALRDEENRDHQFPVPSKLITCTVSKYS